MHAGSMQCATALQALLKLSRNGVSLTQSAQDVLSMPFQDQEAELQLLCQEYKGEPPEQQSTITCMTAVRKTHDEVFTMHTTFGECKQRQYYPCKLR